MTPSRRLFAAITAALMFAATPAFADWIVARISQPAEYAVDGGAWLPLSLGMEVPNHAWIHTGRTGRLLLRQLDDLIQFKPNTVAAISNSMEGGVETTTVLHKFGALLIDVEPRSRRVRVETPYLAIVVKGTRFDVDVNRTSAQVRVRGGVVEATHPTLGLRANVYAGQVAIAQLNRRFAVRGHGPKPMIVQVEPRSPLVRPAGPQPVTAPSHESDNDDVAEDRRLRLERQAYERALTDASGLFREPDGKSSQQDKDLRGDGDKDDTPPNEENRPKKENLPPQDDGPRSEVGEDATQGPIDEPRGG